MAYSAYIFAQSTGMTFKSHSLTTSSELTQFDRLLTTSSWWSIETMTPCQHFGWESHFLYSTCNLTPQLRVIPSNFTEMPTARETGNEAFSRLWKRLIIAFVYYDKRTERRVDVRTISVVNKRNKYNIQIPYKCIHIPYYSRTVLQTHVGLQLTRCDYDWFQWTELC